MPVDPDAPLTLTAFDWVPEFAKGQVRDLRVRWALEETGQDHAVRLLPQGAQKAESHRALPPFGQVPTLQTPDLTLFESGAIVWHIAETFPGLMPADPAARARSLEWLFAALNTVEPPIADRAMATLFEVFEPWSAPRLPGIEARIADRLGETASHLGDGDWFTETFGPGDLMMISVLRILDGTGLLDPSPTLAAYVDRCTARPAFRRALADHMADFTGAPPPGFDIPTTTANPGDLA